MYDQEQIIQIYRQGFFICAGLSVVGGIMTTIFFWKFGIRRIMQYAQDMRRGKKSEGSKKKIVKKKQKQVMCLC